MRLTFSLLHREINQRSLLSVSYAHASYRNRHATVRDFTPAGDALVQKTKDRRYYTLYNSLGIYDIEILRHVCQRSQ